MKVSGAAIRAAEVCVWMAWGVGVLCVGCQRQEARAAEPVRQAVRMDFELTGRATPQVRVHLWDTRALTVTSHGGMMLWSVGANRSAGRIGPDQFCLASMADGQWRIITPQGDNLLPESESLSGTIEFRAEANGFLTVFRDKAISYPGAIRLSPLDDAPDQSAVVNVLDIESYLAGVVGSEMYPHWNKAALRAQSIASRTYALYQILRREGRDRLWDIGSDQMSQMYTGLARRMSSAAQAVSDTRGIVLAYGPAGQEKIFPAYYSAICGGHTEDARAAFGESLPPLKGRPCPYCEAVADPRFYRWSEVALAKSEVSRELMQMYPSLKVLKRIVDIEPTEISEYGRMRRIGLIGESGQKITIRAEEFRLAVSSREKPVRSAWFKLEDDGSQWRFVDGRGWGHGVGLCQCGAQQMAKLGKDCIEIVQFYYPQSVLLRAY